MNSRMLLAATLLGNLAAGCSQTLNNNSDEPESDVTQILSCRTEVCPIATAESVDYNPIAIDGASCVLAGLRDRKEGSYRFDFLNEFGEEFDTYSFAFDVHASGDVTVALDVHSETLDNDGEWESHSRDGVTRVCKLLDASFLERCLGFVTPAEANNSVSAEAWSCVVRSFEVTQVTDGPPWFRDCEDAEAVCQ